MGYFKHFPKTFYSFDGKTGTAVTNILKKPFIRQQIKRSSDVFIQYQLRDGQRLEDLASRQYGNPELYWVIAMYNDIVNPFKDMPRSNTELIDWIETKFSATALFFDESLFQGGFKIGQGISLGESSVGDQGNEIVTYSSYSGHVRSWQPTIRKLIVEKETNANLLSTTGTNRVVGNTTNARGTIQRFMSQKDAVVQFRDIETNEVLNPYMLINGLSILGYYMNRTAPPGVSSVSRMQYEIQKNDLKRKIRVPRRQFALQIEKSVQRVLNGSIIT